MKVLQEGEAVVLEDGNWVKLPNNYMYQRCCRCGLMHLWEFVPTETGVRVCATSLTEEEAQRQEANYQAQVSSNPGLNPTPATR